MALSYLVDTSVVTRLRVPSIHAALEGHVEAGAVGRIGVTDLEVGFSARNEERSGMPSSGRSTTLPLVGVAEEHVIRLARSSASWQSGSYAGGRCPIC